MYTIGLILYYYCLCIYLSSFIILVFCLLSLLSPEIREAIKKEKETTTFMIVLDMLHGFVLSPVKFPVFIYSVLFGKEEKNV